MRRHSYAISSAWAVLMRDLGVDPADVLRRAALPEDLLTRNTPRLAAEDFYRLWAALAAGAPEVPLAIARALSVEAFDPALFAALCSRDLNAAAARIARYKQLIGPIRLDVQRGMAETTLVVRWTTPSPPPATFQLTEALFWVALVRLGTRREVCPLGLTVPAPPAQLAPYLDYLGAAVDTAPIVSVTFAAADAARPFLTAHEDMWGLFEPGLRRRLAQLPGDASATERVRSALLELLPAGQGSAGAVARKLALSKRTLQRRLRAEETSFGAVLATVREELARHYLGSSLMPAAEIAFLLGYGDPNSFYRAFHAWTGSTPETVRAAS